MQIPSATPMTGFLTMPLMGFLTRLYWMFAGHIALLFCLALIACRPGRSLGLYDLVYASLVFCLVLARWVEIKCFAGETTADGTTPSLSDWRRYAATVVSIATIAWLAVRAFLWLRHTTNF